ESFMNLRRVQGERDGSDNRGVGLYSGYSAGFSDASVVSVLAVLSALSALPDFADLSALAALSVLSALSALADAFFSSLADSSPRVIRPSHRRGWMWPISTIPLQALLGSNWPASTSPVP